MAKNAARWARVAEKRDVDLWVSVSERGLGGNEGWSRRSAAQSGKETGRNDAHRGTAADATPLRSWLLIRRGVLLGDAEPPMQQPDRAFAIGI